MNIFNSLGSNYNLDYICHAFLSLFKHNNEDKLKKILYDKYGGEAILFYKGREAIEASLVLSGIENNAYVCVNGFTCYVVEKAVENAGLNCEYLDIDEDLNFSSKTLEKALKNNKNIKAVIIQNTLGNLSDYQGIENVCRKNNLVLIEDLAHTTSTGNSDFVALSFSQDKAIDAVSGGALIIKNKKYLKNVYKISRTNISTSSLIKDIIYPPLTLLIRNLYPIGIGKILHLIAKKLNLLSTPMGDQDKGLHFLPKWNVNLAINYLNNIDTVNTHRKLITKIYGGNSTNIRFPIQINGRDKFIEYMKNNGVHISDIWYESTIAPKKYMSNSSYKVGMCPKSDIVSNNIVNLPTHINVSENDAIKIIELTKKWKIIQ